jgi:hypothetical protein
MPFDFPHEQGRHRERQQGSLRELLRDISSIRMAVDGFTRLLQIVSKDIGNLPAIESLLDSCLSQLAEDLGWQRRVVCKLECLDLPRIVSTKGHQRTSRFTLRGSDEPVHIAINNQAVDPQFLFFVSRIPVYLWLFGAALEKRPELRGSFPCFLGDASFWNVVSFSSNCPDAVLVPDSGFFASGGWSDFRARMNVQRLPWEERTPRVFWRGSATGIKRYWPPRGADDLGWLPRAEFCARVRGSSAIAAVSDVGISRWEGWDPEWARRLEKSVPVANTVPKEEFAKFRYIFDIDGWSNSWEGLFTSLLTGACVLKVQSEYGFRQWYYERLVPWTHFVPIRADLADLECNVRWALDNSGRASEIGEAGRGVVESMDYFDELDTAVDRVIARDAGATLLSGNGDTG